MRHCLTLFTIFLPWILSATITGDSLNYLTPKDTIFLSIGEFEEKLFEHQIEKKQTLYSLCKFYGMEMKELYYYNPGLQDKIISIGDKIRIPVPNRAIIRYRNKKFKDSEHVPIVYIVKKGDTIYKVAKTVFKMPVDSMMVRNNLSSNSLSIGQALHIGWMSTSGISPRKRPFKGTPESKQNQLLHNKYNRGKQVKREYNQQGVAYWQKDGAQKSDFYALHRTAPLNSIISINNPMINKTVYARVIGRIPESVHKKDVIVVVSSKAAAYLGAKDARFFVKIRYLK